MKRTRRALILAIILSCIITLIIAFLYKGGVSRYGNKQYQTVEERGDRALKYAIRNGLNQNYCLLLDYSIPSGTPRLMLWSFAENKVVYKAHAMHGPGNGSTAEHPVFSNKPGSNCSSLGKFEVTKEHGNVNKTGFYLRGREFSNSSARSRGIMLHGSRWVDVNQWRQYIPLNTKSCLGCVTVSSKEMKYLYNLIEKENDHLLLWSYCSESSEALPA